MMDDPDLFWLALVTLLLWLLLASDWCLGVRRTFDLATPAPAPVAGLPSVSVVIPARNEAHTLERALESVLKLDYPTVEIIVLNDRSTDRTGALLDDLKRRYTQLDVVHIEHLPRGWLGKNHALHLGAERANGSWLLFTDADVELDPDLLGAALTHALEHGLDHLTALPHLVAHGVLLRSFIGAFAQLFSFATLRASSRWTGGYAGIGAFNLIRRDVYQELGGHSQIALRPDDDMRLGRLVTRGGYRQSVVRATEFVRVEWYPSLGEAIRGLNKNAFAGLLYSWPLVLLVCGTLLLTHVLPFGAVFFTTGWTRLLYGLVLLIIVGVYVVSRPLSKLPCWYALVHPIGVSLLVYAVLESALKTTLKGGISWRGTFYLLEDLKRGRQ